MALPTLYTKAETAEYLRKSIRSLERLMTAKKITFIQDARTPRFTEYHIQQYLESQTVKAKKTA